MPQHSLASAQINDPGCCSSLHCSHSGPPGGQRLSLAVWLTTSRQSSQRHRALGHHPLLRLVTFPSSWIQTGLLRAGPCHPLSD